MVTTTEGGATTETEVHPVGTTTVKLSAAQMVKFGGTVNTNLIKDPTADGKIFCGWNYNLAKTPVIRDMKVWAKWVEGAKDGEYTADITATITVTVPTGAVKYATGVEAKSTASSDRYTDIADEATTISLPAVNVTDAEGKIVVSSATTYIKWVTAEDVVSLHELTVDVSDGTYAANSVTLTKDVDRGIGTFEPYMTSSTNAELPQWVGGINGNLREKWENDGLVYQFAPHAGIDQHFNLDTHPIKDYDTLHVDFTAFTGESYTGTPTVTARCYINGNNSGNTVSCTAEISEDGTLKVSVPLSGIGATENDEYVRVDMVVTVGGWRQH